MKMIQNRWHTRTSTRMIHVSHSNDSAGSNIIRVPVPVAGGDAHNSIKSHGLQCPKQNDEPFHKPHGEVKFKVTWTVATRRRRHWCRRRSRGRRFRRRRSEDAQHHPELRHERLCLTREHKRPHADSEYATSKCLVAKIAR